MERLIKQQHHAGQTAAYAAYFVPRLRSALEAMDAVNREQLQEIRLRCARPMAVCLHGQEYFLTAAGSITRYPQQGILVQQRELEEVFRAVCSDSVYRYAQELREGFVTIAGGARVGIAGTAVYRDGVLQQIRDISSLNFRIPSEQRNCAAALAERIAAQSGGVLLAGAVGSGKTTMLRDLCRIIGDRERVSLIDTRGELAGTVHGVAQYDIGLHTDVLDGFPRSAGAGLALRVLTPTYVICDEIGTEADVAALLQLHGCGVRILATVHAGGVEDLLRRSSLRTLIAGGVFTHAALLGTGSALGTVQRFVRLEEYRCSG